MTFLWDCACLYQTVNMVVFFLKIMKYLTPQMKRGNCQEWCVQSYSSVSPVFSDIRRLRYPSLGKSSEALEWKLRGVRLRQGLPVIHTRWCWQQWDSGDSCRYQPGQTGTRYQSEGTILFFLLFSFMEDILVIFLLNIYIYIYTVLWDILVSSNFCHFGSDSYSFILASLILATLSLHGEK